MEYVSGGQVTDKMVRIIMNHLLSSGYKHGVEKILIFHDLFTVLCPEVRGMGGKKAFPAID
jgi:hypothetical protein